jgi:hypothetical protein
MGGVGTEFYSTFSDNIPYLAIGSNTRKTCGAAPFSLGNWHVLRVTSQANDWNCYLNGTLLFNTATNTVGFPPAGDQAHTPQVGHNGGTAYLTGSIAMVYFGTLLSAGDLTKMTGFVNSQYGFSLP